MIKSDEKDMRNTFKPKLHGGYFEILNLKKIINTNVVVIKDYRKEK